MKTNENDVNVLNDLVAINNDRVTGYKKAIDELKNGDNDLQSVFNEMITHSEQHLSGLKQKVRALGGDPETGTTTSGKIYRAWMDIKAAFSGNERQTALDNCEYGEDAALKAYKNALEEEDLSAEVRTLITDQQAALKQDHDKIKRLRDSHQPAAAK